MEELVELADSIRQASALISGTVPDDDDNGPSTFLQALVLGSLGAGKSGVLNSMIGHPVLPTAEGGATRFPLVVDLKRDQHVPKNGVRGSIGQNTNLLTAADIRRAVKDDMKRWLPTSSRIHEQTHLVIRSSSAPPLRLIDLPGLESRASEQDNLVRDNATSSDAILFVIIPASNVKDVVSARAVRLAHDLDREGNRTLGIITKLDKVDHNDKNTMKLVVDLLSGEGPSLTQDFPWVAVIGQPLDENSTVDYLENAWEVESKTLSSLLRAAGGKNLDEKIGRSGLLHVLAQLIRNRMKDRIPKLLSSLEEKSQEVEDELFKIGKSLITDVEASRSAALELCRGFEVKFLDHILGSEDGGSKMVEKFVNTLPNRFRALPLDEIFGLENVKKVALEADGYLPYLISPEKGLRLLVRRTLELAKQPGLTCVDEVHKILLDIVATAGNTTPSLNRFPPLKKEIVAIASNVVDGYRAEARNMVVALVDMERVFIPPAFFMEANARRQEKLWREESSLRKRELERGSKRSTESTSEPGKIASAMSMFKSKKETPPPPPPGPLPELSGYLWKVSSKNGWSKRWFALSDKTARLYYVKKPDEKAPRGVIPLEDCIIDDSVPLEDHPPIPGLDSDKNKKNTETNVFRISNSVPYKTVVKVHHSLIIRAENASEKTQWVNRLRLLTKAGRKEMDQSQSNQVKQKTDAEEEENASNPDNPSLPPSSSVSSTQSEAISEKVSSFKRPPKDPDAELKSISEDVRQYVESVLLHLSENIPKAIILTQVERVKESLLTKLYTSISVMSEEKVGELLEEDPESKHKRESVQKQQSVLEKLRRSLSLQGAQASMGQLNLEGYLPEKENPMQEEWRQAFRSASINETRVDEEGGESLFVPYNTESTNGRTKPASQGRSSRRPPPPQPEPNPPIPRSGSSASGAPSRGISPLHQDVSPSRQSPLRSSSPGSRVAMNGGPLMPSPSVDGPASMGAPMRPGRQAPAPPGSRR